jgi:hypothetical protein
MVICFSRFIPLRAMIARDGEQGWKGNSLGDLQPAGVVIHMIHGCRWSEPKLSYQYRYVDMCAAN